MPSSKFPANRRKQDNSRTLASCAGAFVLLTCSCMHTTPAHAQFDSFSLPPGAEYTPIPQRMRYDGGRYRDRAGQEQAEAEPFSLKEFKPGMSLDDFMKVSAPGSADPSAVRSVCSCETNQSVETVTAEDQAAKVIQCGFWNKSADKIQNAYRMTIAGIEASPDFRFVEDGGVYRLFEITVSFYSSNFANLQQALTQKFGAPAASRATKVTTASGNIHKGTNLIWDNGVSRILLSDVDGGNMARGTLRYFHSRLAGIYNQRVREYRGEPAKRASDDL